MFGEDQYFKGGIIPPFIHPTAAIAEGVEIEEGVYIGPFCIIGYPPEWRGKEQFGKGVLIKAGARLTGMITVDAGAEGRTVIGRNCYLMKHAHVGHDAHLGDDVTISCGAKIGGHTIILEGANIGLNAVIHQQQVIAEGVMIGMGSVVTKKLQTEPYKVYAGTPAKLIGDNVKHPKWKDRG